MDFLGHTMSSVNVCQLLSLELCNLLYLHTTPVLDLKVNLLSETTRSDESVEL